jgi:hypothetical protein
LSFLVVVFGGGVSFSLTTFTALGVVWELLVKKKKSCSPAEKSEFGIAGNALQHPVRKFHGLLSAASEIP